MRVLFTMIAVMAMLSVYVSGDSSQKPIVGQPTPFEETTLVLRLVEDEAAGDVILEAPAVCEVGELVRLNASNSQVDGLTWKVLPFTEDFEVIDNGLRALFSARVSSSGTEFLVIIAGAKGGVPYLVHHTLRVKAMSPTTGLTAKIATWLRSVPDEVDKRARLLAMSGVFRRLSTQDIDVDQILYATALANSAVLGDALESWAAFLDALGKELDELIAADKLETRRQFRNVWAEIAEGLEYNARE